MNYDLQLREVMKQMTTPNTLLLHSCCAPCSSYVLEFLSEYFEITVFYYNPNINLEEEYTKRSREQERLCNLMTEEGNGKHPIHFLQGKYEPHCFLNMAKGLEDCPEGGQRCRGCFALRLEETAKLAKEKGFDYFTTSLTISPLKNAQILNEIGAKLGEVHQVPFLPSDFKKKNGYQRSVELSQIFGLYRQDYCGCIYSMK